MPNSDANGIVDSTNLVESSNEKGEACPLVNGVHDAEDKVICFSNGDTVLVNGDVEPPSNKTENSVGLPMKIVRKRHSDSETFLENAKKTKIDDSSYPHSEPSPLLNDVGHDPMKVLTEAECEKTEELEHKTDLKGLSNGIDKAEKTKSDDDIDSPSVLVCVDEDIGSPINSVKEEKSDFEDQPKDEKPDTAIKNEESDADDENKELPTPSTQSLDVGIQTAYLELSIDEKKSLLRSELLSMYSTNLKNASSKSLSLFQKLAQTRTTQNNNWQSKYYNLHNRFLHLKVSTDKMMESVSKEEKESRTVESQTDGAETKDAKSLPAPSGSQTRNGISNPNTQVNNRLVGSTSPAKSVTSTTSATSNSTNPSTLPTHVSQPLQQIQNSISHNVPANQHQSNKLSNQQVNTSQNQPIQHQPSKTQPSQPVQQQTQQVFLLSTRPSAPQNTQVVALPSNGSNVIDLTDDDSAANAANLPLRSTGSTTLTTINRTHSRQSSSIQEPNRVRHPMALPRMTATTISHGCCRGLPPPSPQLTVTRTEDGKGVCLQWNIPNYTSTVYSRIKRYRLFNYSQTSQSVFYSFQNPWKEIGSVDSMDLPMACTLTQIQDNSVYHFAIRPVDEYERLGIWSNTATIEMSSLNS